MATPSFTQLGLKQYTKDVPPGFRPGAYPVSEWYELLKVWSVLTVHKGKDAEMGAAIYSRLELGALDLARRLVIPMYNSTDGLIHQVTGIEACQLPAQDAVPHPTTGAVFFEAQASGAAQLIQAIVNEYKTEDQDKAWMALQSFFEHTGDHKRFLEYDAQFWSRFDKAREHAGLAIGPSGLGYLYWSKAGVDDSTVADLRLKVDGDLTRYREMITLYKRIVKNEESATNIPKTPYPLFHLSLIHI